MTSQDDLALLKRMYQRGEITDEQYDVLRRHVLWGTPLPQLVDDVPAPRPPAGAGPGGYVPGVGTVGPARYPEPGDARHTSGPPEPAPPDPGRRYAGEPGGGRYPAGASDRPAALPPDGRRYASRRERREAEEAGAAAYSASTYLPPAGGYTPPIAPRRSRHRRHDPDEAPDQARIPAYPPPPADRAVAYDPPATPYPRHPAPVPAEADLRLAAEAGLDQDAPRRSRRPAPDPYDPAPRRPYGADLEQAAPTGRPAEADPDLDEPPPRRSRRAGRSAAPEPDDLTGRGSRRGGRAVAPEPEDLTGRGSGRRGRTVAPEPDDLTGRGSRRGGRAVAPEPDDLTGRRSRRAEPEDLATRRVRRPVEADPELDEPEPRRDVDGGRGAGATVARRRPHRRSVVAVLASVVLALLLAAGGVYWFVLRADGMPPATYARQTCGSVRDWQQAVDSSNATLVSSISRQANPNTVRADVVAYYATVATRTDGLRTTILDRGPADVPGGREYSDSLAAAVGDQATALRALADRARRLDPDAATFQADVQAVLTGADTAVSAVSAALARPAAGITTELRTTLSNEPACAPYVG